VGTMPDLGPVAEGKGFEPLLTRSATTAFEIDPLDSPLRSERTFSLLRTPIKLIATSANNPLLPPVSRRQCYERWSPTASEARSAPDQEPGEHSHR
jgi:hypothetical protein